jgi:hypothetical protein
MYANVLLLCSTSTDTDDYYRGISGSFLSVLLLVVYRLVCSGLQKEPSLWATLHQYMNIWLVFRTGGPILGGAILLGLNQYVPSERYKRAISAKLTSNQLPQSESQRQSGLS